jgi:hypothetical protein
MFEDGLRTMTADPLYYHRFSNMNMLQAMRSELKEDVHSPRHLGQSPTRRGGSGIV